MSTWVNYFINEEENKWMRASGYSQFLDSQIELWEARGCGGGLGG